MSIHDRSKYNARLTLARRGRPRTASDELRENNYKDEDGKYSLTGGLKPWHERITDFMLIQPNAKIVDIAEAFDVTPQWIGQLIKTDAFREHYMKVMEAHQDILHVQVMEKMGAVAIKALDKISDHLDTETVTIGQAREAASLSLQGMGFIGNRTGVAVNVRQGDNGIASVRVESSALSAAQERIQRRMRENSAKHSHDGSDYQYVTSSLEKPQEDIEDAIVISDEESGSTEEI